MRSANVYIAVGFVLLMTFAHCEIPDGYGQLENAPELIPGGTDEQRREYFYLGQKAGRGKLILTASNGFFTKGACTAKGTSRLPKVGDEELIVPNFEYLDWKNREGSLRWYILTKKRGVVHFQVHMDVAKGGSAIAASFAGQTRQVTTAKSGHGEPQSWDLNFEVEQGEHVFSLQSASPGGGGIGQLHRVDVFGSAIEDGNLLRVRWRPAAAHGGYDTERVRNVKLLVFTTRSTCDISSYSPITTPFGYYGTSFDGDRRSNGSFNFSMWGKEDSSKNIKLMPHLLAVGSPDGEFSGFGHEGSGVKPRGWDPMRDRPGLVVQALRLVNGEEYDTYYGYYFDHPSNSWKLYGAGNKWHGGKPNAHLKLGSFCEVPGPPQSERTGDVSREVRRRGWAWDDGKWVPLEIYNPGGMGSSGSEAVNKSWYTSDDGEYVMGCGGIRLYKHKEDYVKPAAPVELPGFLTSPSVKKIFGMPIEYKNIQTAETGSTEAVVEVDVAGGEGIAYGMLYYGTRDALTFAPRELHGTEKKSSLSQSINEMSWQNSVEIAQIKPGRNRVTVSGLKPSTTYHYRVLMNNAVSRVWNDTTMSFTTAASGMLSPRPSTGVSEPHRNWSYSVDGELRTLEGRITGIDGEKIQIERKSDGRKGSISIDMFSREDQEYISSIRERLSQ
ncbi:MAG: fibronectin type III domain-containing protein [Verrucomicrobiales bacterium]|nr:fibronectin type III domain-containing protein [Verrucomicrobiales bacterium]